MMATILLRSQPLQNCFSIYRGLPCNSLMADSCSDRTPLHDAAYQGRLLNLMELIAQGFQVNTLTMDGVSPLHEACLGGHHACAKFLLENGANAQAVSTDGATPLFNSCSSGSAACVRLLLQHGASIHTTPQLASPLHQAAKKGHRECMELLLSCGAQIDVELPNVGTPLYAACRAPSAQCVELLLHSGADVGPGCGQDSPLHAAVRAGEANIVELLLEFGAEKACRNSEGKTPLDLSAPNSAVRAALQRKGPCSLTQLCRFSIRRSLGRLRLHRTSNLLLPQSVINFLLYR
ncbi:PREDICTED: ankyrin repeat and SOCS box protein 11-like [Cyprinodon variegatus]|uniref:Ankyrin repeat and SOCS box protein 11 n=1 Tax=Cyprinodon variegatus TaxID=28743 RepID=A0A3Q2D4R5_CYPVA|nr:PREDICTED: ankyrin repeat and SOCS box protein 11-like [Cyprinodon variegatus]